MIGWLNLYGASDWYSDYERRRQEEERRRRERDKQPPAPGIAGGDLFGDSGDGNTRHLGESKWGAPVKPAYGGNYERRDGSTVARSWDEDVDRRARNAGLSALFGGLLDSYMNDGEGIGDAFTGMSSAQQGVRDRAEERQRYELQRAEIDRDRRRQLEQDSRQQRRDDAYISNIEADNKRAQDEIERKAREREERTAYQRRLVETLPPEKRQQFEPLYGEAEFESAWVKATSPPDEAAARAARAEERAARAEERSVTATERSIQRDEREEAQQAQREWERQVESRADEIYAAWEKQRLAKVGNPISESDRRRFGTSRNAGARLWETPSTDEQMQFRAWARQRAEQEVGPAPSRATIPATSTDDGAPRRRRFNPETGELE